MSSTLIKKIVGTVAVGTLGLGAVAMTVPGASAMVNNGAKFLAQQDVQPQNAGYGRKPNCVNGEHIDRGNNKNQGNGGCSDDHPSNN